MSGAAVSDTSPLNYLILIDAVELPRIFSRIVIPRAVKRELTCDDTPLAVRTFIDSPRSWLFVAEAGSQKVIEGLDEGESEAIQVALELGISTVLIDERIGFGVATSLGLKPIGLLGLLEFAAERGWISFDELINRLRGTTFRFSEKLVNDMRERLTASG